MTTATANLRQRAREAVNRAGLPRFWRWWIGELAPLLPGASRAAIQRRFARPVIQLADGQAVFWRPEIANGSARLAATESVSLAGDAAAVLAAGRAAVARLAANASGGIAAPKVIVALGSRQVLRKELALPAAVEENLLQALGYELDRHTPFRAEQLYFDAAVISRDATKKMLRVDWVAALREIVDGARKQVEEWGAIPVAVVPGPPTTTPTRLNLLPSAARPRPFQWKRWQLWAPLALVVVLAAAVVFVPLVQKRQYAIALGELSAEAGAQAQVADKLRSELERMQNDYNYVLARKYAFPSVIDVLDQVTRVLPDDTWLTQLELKTGAKAKDQKEPQRELYLRGESANAGKLIALLEDSKLVDQVAPRSPTTKIQGASGEIFDLGGHLRPLPPPAALALADLPPLPPPPNAVSAPAPASTAVPTSAASAASPEKSQRAATPAPAAQTSAVAPSQPASQEAPPMFGPFPPGYTPPPSPTTPQRANQGPRMRQSQPPVPVPPAQPPAAQPAAVAAPAEPAQAAPALVAPAQVAPTPPAVAPEPATETPPEGEQKTEED